MCITSLTCVVVINNANCDLCSSSNDWSYAFPAIVGPCNNIVCKHDVIVLLWCFGANVKLQPPGDSVECVPLHILCYHHSYAFGSIMFNSI